MDEQTVMYEFRVTFGQRYRGETHERIPVAHPDGYMAVHASTEDIAYSIIREYIGQQYAQIYAVGPAMNIRKFASNGDDIDWTEQFPKGEVFRVMEGAPITE